MKFDETKLKIALPNKGRLRQPALELFKKAGFHFRARERALYASCSDYGITFIFLRADDIPVLVDSGAVDLGITGQDLIAERAVSVREILPLAFGRCRLCVAGHESLTEGELGVFEGQTIATSFPRITEEFFKARGVGVACKTLNGSVEIMVALGMARGIVDIVETGDSLRANQLKVIATIGQYETVLIAHPERASEPGVQQIRRKLEGILIAEKYSMLEYNIPAAKLAEAEGITPGFESPTISTLEEKDWLAVKVMVEKKQIIAVMDSLEQLGATAIIETEITNCRL